MAADEGSGLRERLRSTRQEAEGLRGEASEIAAELQRLFQLEAELGRAEAAEATRHATRAAAFAAAAAVMVVICAVFVFLTLMFVLDTFMPLWLAALLTTLIVAGLISLLAVMARQEFEQFSPAPRRLIRSIREDVEWAKTQLRSSAK